MYLYSMHTTYLCICSLKFYNKILKVKRVQQLQALQKIQNWNQQILSNSIFFNLRLSKLTPQNVVLAFDGVLGGQV